MAAYDLTPSALRWTIKGTNLADAAFGAGAPAPTGPRFQSPNAAAVLAAFDTGLGRVMVVNERLAKR